MPRHQDEDDDDTLPTRPRKRRDEDAPPKRRRPADDEERRPSSRSRRRDEDDDYDDEPRSRSRKSSRPESKQVSVLGIISLVKGGLALIASFIPCMGVLAYFPAGLALLIGIGGLIVAKKSKGKQSTGLPIAGISVSIAAILIATVWLVILNSWSKKVEEREEQSNKASQQEVDTMKNEVAVKTTVETFVNEFKAGEAKTVAKYASKTVEITGTVDWFDLDGNPFIRLKAPLNYDVVATFRLGSEKTKLRALRLKKGDVITIRGRCTKISDGAMTLDHCIVVP